MKIFVAVASLTVLACALAVVTGWLSLSDVPERPKTIGSPSFIEHPTSTTDSGSVLTQEDLSEPRALLEIGQPPVLGIRGRVISKRSQQPVQARIQAGVSSVDTEGVSGEFVLTFRDSPAFAMITAVNHKPEQVPLSAVKQGGSWIDLGAIALEPLALTLVRVVSTSGGAQQDATIRALPTFLQDDSVTPQATIGTTDSNGQLELALDRPLVLGAFHEGQGSEPVMVCPDDRQVTLSLVRSASRLGMRDSRSQSPIAGARMALTRIDLAQRIVFDCESGADGFISDPIPPGTYRVKPDPSLTLAPGPFLLPGPAGKSICVITLDGYEDVWIDVAEHSPPRIIRMVDAKSGNPVGPASGWLASYEELPFAETPEWVRLGSVLHAEGPELRLNLRTSDSTIRFFGAAPGYALNHIDDPGAVVLPGSPFDLPLEPTQLRRIVVTDKEGCPFLHRIVVKNARTDVHLFDGVPTSHGTIGPFGWEGDNVAVTLSEQSNASVLAEVTQEQLMANEEVHVSLADLGTLSVHGVPDDHVQLLCYDNRGFRSHGTRRGPSITFEQLLPGEYELGTLYDFDTLDLRIAQGLIALSISLAQGQSRDIPWDERWTPSVPITGRVVAVGVSARELYVVPASCDKRMRPITGSSALRYSITDQWEYQIPSFSNQVTRLDFVLQQPTGLLAPVASCLVGETPEIQCGRLVIDCKSVSIGEEVLAEYTPKIVGIDVRQRIVSGRTGPGLLDLGPVCVQVDEVAIRVKSRSRVIPTRIKAGATSTITF